MTVEVLYVYEKTPDGADFFLCWHWDDCTVYDAHVGVPYSRGADCYGLLVCIREVVFLDGEVINEI